MVKQYDTDTKKKRISQDEKKKERHVRLILGKLKIAENKKTSFIQIRRWYHKMRWRLPHIPNERRSKPDRVVSSDL